MKRFYKRVSTSADYDGFFAVQLDTKPVMTPVKNILKAPTEELADAIAAEWAAQTDEIIPAAMPLTQIMTTALDRIMQEREVVEQATLKYLDTDLLCYRTAHPPELAGRQQEMWGLWLDWFEKEYDVKLETTTELKALAQPEETHQKITESVQSMDDLHFNILQLVTSLSGSIVLGLAFVRGAIDPDQLFETLYVDENYKADIYNEHLHGKAPHEEDKQKAVMRELLAAREFLNLLRP